jgi:hypothetical protein
MVTSVLSVEDVIAEDILLSFWPFPPERVLAVGAKSISVGLAVAQVIPSLHLTLVSPPDHKDQLAEVPFRDRLTPIIGEHAERDWGDGYQIVLAYDQLGSLDETAQIEFLSKAQRSLCRGGRTLSIEMIGTYGRGLSSLHLNGICRAAGCQKVTVTAIENSVWSVALFERDRYS